MLLRAEGLCDIWGLSNKFSPNRQNQTVFWFTVTFFFGSLSVNGFAVHYDGVGLHGQTLLSAAYGTASTLFSLSAALFASFIAAFAIIVTLISPRFLFALSRSKSEVADFSKFDKFILGFFRFFVEAFFILAASLILRALSHENVSNFLKVILKSTGYTIYGSCIFFLAVCFLLSFILAIKQLLWNFWSAVIALLMTELKEFEKPPASKSE